MQRFKITHGQGFEMIERESFGDALGYVAAQERAQPGRYGRDVAVLYCGEVETAKAPSEQEGR